MPVRLKFRYNHFYNLSKGKKTMGKIQLDPKIIGQMGSWGANYNNMDGCSHDSADDKVSKEITSKDNTLNVPSKMDASHAKPNNLNPGVDKSFWAKAMPLDDTTGHGRLTRKLQD